MKKPVICVGIPSFAGLDYDVAQDYMNLFFHLGRRCPEYDFQLAIKGKSEQFRARNAIVKAALQYSADYILMLDDDHIFDIGDDPKEAYDLPIKLVKHLEDNPKIGVVGALYYQRGGDCHPVFMQEKDGLPYFVDMGEVAGGMQKVDITGGGCMMIRASMFDKIEEPWFAPEHEFGTDIQLAHQVKKAGYEVWIDTSLEIGHLQRERAVISSKNRKEFITTPSRQELTFVDEKIVVDDFVKDVMEYTGYKDKKELFEACNSFMELSEIEDKGSVEWYQKYPMERVARQAAFMLASEHKQDLLKGALQSLGDESPKRILDFGCGTGTIGFELAKRGHDVHFLDILNTGTFNFLQWRMKKHGLKAHYWETQGGPPSTLDGNKYDVIIAMDSIEHIEDWKGTIKLLYNRIKYNGIMLSNNGILDDQDHPEHYELRPTEFTKEMIETGFQTVNLITYLKTGKF